MLLYRRLHGPGLIAEYARESPDERDSISYGNAIGVAFAPQNHAVWSVGRVQQRRGSIPPSSVFLVPAEGLYWSRWDRTSDSVEMWLDPALLGQLSSAAGGPSRVAFDYRELLQDPVIVNVASVARRAIHSPSPPDELRLETVAVFLGVHLLKHYHGLKPCWRGRVRPLAAAALQRVGDFVEAHLNQPLRLTELAEVANQSPYHFARAFGETTGSPPHAFVNARRMEYAMVLLRETTAPVADIAMRVGFRSLSHFRSHFLRAWGDTPSRVRADGGRSR